MVTPPLSFFFKVIAGRYLLSLIPKPSNSLSIMRLSVNGFIQSRTIKIKVQVLATPIT
jgi:hypothetical protein